MRQSRLSWEYETSAGSAEVGGGGAGGGKGEVERGEQRGGEEE